jgi:hypothetical protein
VGLFVPKGCFTAYVIGLTVVDEIFWPQLYLQFIFVYTFLVFINCDKTNMRNENRIEKRQ